MGIPPFPPPCPRMPLTLVMIESRLRKKQDSCCIQTAVVANDFDEPSTLWASSLITKGLQCNGCSDCSPSLFLHMTKHERNLLSILSILPRSAKDIFIFQTNLPRAASIFSIPRSGPCSQIHSRLSLQYLQCEKIASHTSYVCVMPPYFSAHTNLAQEDERAAAVYCTLCFTET